MHLNTISRKYMYTPHHFPLCTQVERGEGPAMTRQGHGLPTDAIVFCAFHNLFKVDDEVWEVWMHLLRRIPASVLWLLRRADAVDAIQAKVRLHTSASRAPTHTHTHPL
jgi:protein O-GlcNAc transferase